MEELKAGDNLREIQMIEEQKRYLGDEINEAKWIIDEEREERRRIALYKKVLKMIQRENGRKDENIVLTQSFRGFLKPSEN